MAFLPWKTILEDLRATSNLGKLPNTSVLALAMKLEASQFQTPLSFELMGSRGKTNNTSGVSQNAEAVAGESSLAFKCLKGLHS